MLRLLIVDDEILVRIGLKTIIPMEGQEFAIVGEAATGVEALAIMEQTPCDIVLTDIRMPDMDGLELLKIIHERWPETKVLILSNHDDFAYVQTALRHGAAEYIIKLEIEPAELMLKLRAIKEKLDLQREKHLEVSRLEFKVNQYGREVKEKRLRELLLRSCSRREMEETFAEFGIAPFLTPAYVVVAQIEGYERLLENNRFQSERLLNFTVANVFAEILKKYGNSELAEIGGGTFAIVKDGFEPAMLDELRHAVKAFLKLSVGFGVSRPLQDAFGLHAAYSEAAEALEFRFYAGAGQTVYHSKLPVFAPAVPLLSLEEDAWLRLLEKQSEEGLQQLLADWVRESQSNRSIRPAVLREQWIRLVDLFARSLKEEGVDIYAVTLHDGQYPYKVIRGAETLEELHGWFSGWIPVFFRYKKEQGRHTRRSEIQIVVNRIQEQYHLPLKVSELAAEVGFTENYLSILFKKETGETITDFMTRVRMKKARELLKNPEQKIYEVSEQVGYADPNHFSRSFKQLEGMYPTEFRKLALGKS